MADDEARKILAKNLQYYLDKKGVDRNELCAALNLKYSTVSEWFQGNKYPRIDKIEMLANYFGVKKSDLIEKPVESNMRSILPQENIRMIPVYESVSAGFGAYADNYITGYIPLYIANDEEAKNTMCIVVTGDSMYPKIENGDKIQVLRQDWAENGQVVVALIDEENGVIKKIEYDDNSIRLISFNPEYQPREFVGEERERIRILGIVKTVIKQL